MNAFSLSKTERRNELNRLQEELAFEIACHKQLVKSCRELFALVVLPENFSEQERQTMLDGAREILLVVGEWPIVPDRAADERAKLNEFIATEVGKMRKAKTKPPTRRKSC